MNCRLCNSPELNYLYSVGNDDKFDYYRCKNCGLVNLDLTGLNFSEHQNQYYERFIPPEDYEKEKGARDAYGFIKKYVPEKGRFFDIGCGSGGVLYFAIKDGWEVKGLEISSDFAEYVSKRFSIEVDTANFQEYDYKGEKFDIVSLRHVLEHLPDSILAMNKISGFLKEGAYAHFEFPNINGIAMKTRRFLKRIGIRKPKYKSEFRPGHCNDFSKGTFLYLLNQTGFKLIRWETYSFSSAKNIIYNRLHVGAKARAIVQKVS
jgi:SAM-dependent methyltransferase